MKKFLRSFVVALITVSATSASLAQTATGSGGAGGTGGTALGGTATGGQATNTSNIGSATSNYQGGADVNVNYVTPAGSDHVTTDLRQSGTTKIKNTPDVNLGGPASGACNGLSGGIGVGVPGLAVGGNVSTVDKACEARETARVAAMLGRMDVANAILENMDVVVAALKAKSARDASELERSSAAQAQAQRANTANAALAQAMHAQEADNVRFVEQAAREQAAAALRSQQAARDREADAMRAQQQVGVEALSRQATMAKVNDTLTFTGKLTHGEEKTAQQMMAADLVAKQQAAETERAAADAARANVASTQTDSPKLLAQTPAKSDAQSPAAPLAAMPLVAAQSASAEPKPEATKAPPPARREAMEKRKPLPIQDKSDTQAAVRFALGLTD